MRPMLLALPALAAALAGCGDLFYLEIDEPKLCVTLEKQEVPGTLLPLLHRGFQYDLTPALPKNTVITDTDLDVFLLGFQVRTAGGIDDFDFLDSARINVFDEAQPEVPADLLASWAKPPGERVGPEISFDVVKDANLGAALKKRRVRMVATMEGDMPIMDWALDAEACFRMKGRVYYLR